MAILHNGVIIAPSILEQLCKAERPRSRAMSHLPYMLQGHLMDPARDPVTPQIGRRQGPSGISLPLETHENVEYLVQAWSASQTPS